MNVNKKAEELGRRYFDCCSEGRVIAERLYFEESDLCVIECHWRGLVLCKSLWTYVPKG